MREGGAPHQCSRADDRLLRGISDTGRTAPKDGNGACHHLVHNRLGWQRFGGCTFKGTAVHHNTNCACQHVSIVHACARVSMCLCVCVRACACACACAHRVLYRSAEESIPKGYCPKHLWLQCTCGATNYYLPSCEPSLRMVELARAIHSGWLFLQAWGLRRTCSLAHQKWQVPV